MKKDSGKAMAEHGSSKSEKYHAHRFG